MAEKNIFREGSRHVVFVDTDSVPAKESRVGNLVQNTTEAAILQQTVKALLHGGVQESQIGVISLYRQQVKLLSHMLDDHRGVEILTADRSQGRDKDCIIISMVRSNDSNNIGELLKDWRRLNVSFTRARSKLIIIGSRGILDGTKLLQESFGLMGREDWMYKLPKDAHLMHDPEYVQQQQPRQHQPPNVALHPLQEQRKQVQLPLLPLRPANGLKRKRTAATMEKENEPDTSLLLSPSPRKKRKVVIEKTPSVSRRSKVASGTAILRGRAMLKDVIMEDQTL
ncbi:DNA replication ATP-dependent helicase/nuclease dna2 Includes: RecName: Full=DNA replication nuclease dna2; Includes: RecName: Full=DNA replication ATP-dependent helicase dna2 [Serendipita indica DSM 11827]|nr:DNA replication ATP-dependent helicase/nuclease dna2 Includes: RecName: Full=DNA replication nuclease dna2; Includes: RecName: Full=DNA replication ATP-dependent helicase dna2 [Serendipita indica DSM 11827]